jgi:DNA-binding NarL/FixJ family response regulator
VREADRAAALRCELASSTREHSGSTSDAAGLTSRELEVLRLVAQGLSTQEIAVRLVLSEHTVHRHVANILIKLDLPTRAAAVAYAARHSLL